MLIVGLVLIIIGSILLILFTNTTVKKIGGLFIGLGVLIFIIGVIASYTLLEATAKTVKGDKTYRRKEQEREEGDPDATAKTLAISK